MSSEKQETGFTPTEDRFGNVAGGALDELDFEYATSVAEKTMRAMAAQRVPPTPNNFQVWFKYSLGTSPELRRAIDILIGNKRKFDAATNQGLFATYIGQQGADEAATHKASQQLHSVMDSARQFLATAIADNQSQIRPWRRRRGQRSGADQNYRA